MTTGKSRKTPSGEPFSLAEILRDAARRSGLSVYRIAKDAGVDQSTLNKFLKGERDGLQLDIADRLFVFFGLKVVSTGRGKTRQEKP